MKNKIVNLYLLTFLFSFYILHPAFSADSASVNPLNVAIKGTGSGVPVGTVITWPVGTNPSDAENWLECDGQAISQSVYPELYALVGNKVPNYSGIFLRGYGSQTSTHYNTVTHSSDGMGVIQGDAIRNITGTFGHMHVLPLWSSNGLFSGYHDYDEGHDRQIWKHPGASFVFNAAAVVPTANENRPVNKAVRYLIRAKT